MKPGSHERAAEIIARALLRAGATNLELKLATEIASYGDHCFLTDVAMRSVLKKHDGSPYHVGSIGRSRRLMSRRGWIGSERVLPLQKPKGARWESRYGTTNKWVGWKALGLKNPLTRGERRERAPLPERPETTPRARTAVGRLLDRIGGGGASAPIQRRRAREPLRPVGPIRHDAELPPVGERAASILALLDTLKRGPP